MTDTFLERFRHLLEENSSPKLIHKVVLDHLAGLPFRSILRRYIEVRRSVVDLGVVDFLKSLEEIEERLYGLILQLRVPLTQEEQREVKNRLIIVQREYPEVGPDTDRDFEQYLLARSREDWGGSRNVYGRLLNKYPDVDVRSNLLRFWRKGRGLFNIQFLEAKLQLGARLESRIRNFISTLVDIFAHTGSQTLALMGSIRQAVKILPPSRDVALVVLERLEGYSRLLAWHSLEFESIVRILKSFYEESLFEQLQVTLVLSPQKAKKRTPTVQKIDLAKVKFSKEDLRHILVPPHIQGSTNLTLAYCHKYWLRVGDQVFENKVLLYSQKYKTWHYDVFRTLQTARSFKADDEVVLMRVYQTISRSLPYDYDIRRELIMQAVWRKIRPQPVVKRSQLAASTEEREAQVVPSTPQQTREKQSRRPRRVQAKTVEPVRAVRPVPPPETERLPVGTSIMDRIWAVDTSEQRNLHLVFRKKLEPEIESFVHDYIYEQRLEIKPYTVSLATISIKNFILGHMDTPERDWMLSNERQEVSELGLNVLDVEPIIETCMKKLATAPNLGR